MFIKKDFNTCHKIYLIANIPNLPEWLINKKYKSKVNLYDNLLT